MAVEPKAEKKATGNAYSAVRWSIASRYGAQAMQFAISLLLAYLLAPEFFGLVGMATVVTAFAKTLKSLGFNAAIIQRDDVDHALLSTLFWVNLGFCGVITLAVICVSPIANFIYQDDRVAPLVMVLALSILIDSFCMVPSSLLQRRLEFKKLAIRELGGVVVMGVTGVTCALMGLGVWSLVFSSLSGSISNFVLLNLVERFVPSFTLDRVRLKECLKFGLNITGYNIFNFFAKHSDNLIIGATLGPVALGYYSLGYRFMLLPRDSISRVISRVLFPKLSELKNDDARLGAAFIRTSCGVAMLTFPAMAGLAIMAGPFIRSLLDERWYPAIPVVALLAPVGAIQSLTVLCGSVFLSKARADRLFRWGVIVAIVHVVAFLIGSMWGVVGVAACYLAANLLLFVPHFAIPFSLVKGLTVRRLLYALSPFCLATLLMSAGVIATCQVMQNWYIGVSSWATLIVGVAVGVVSYTTLMLVIRPPALDDYVSLLGIRKLKPRRTHLDASTPAP